MRDSLIKLMPWMGGKGQLMWEYIPTSQPFGYRLVDGKIEVYEKEAQVVQTIFNSYLSGAGTTEIAKWLNDQQFCKKWSQRAVSRSLRNEKYIGDSLWQKTYQTSTLPQRNAVNNGILENTKCGMGLVTAKLRETAAHVIAMSVLVLNLRRIQRALLRMLAYLLEILAQNKNWALVQWTLI